MGKKKEYDPYSWLVWREDRGAVETFESMAEAIGYARGIPFALVARQVGYTNSKGKLTLTTHKERN